MAQTVVGVSKCMLLVTRTGDMEKDVFWSSRSFVTVRFYGVDGTATELSRFWPPSVVVDLPDLEHFFCSVNCVS